MIEIKKLKEMINNSKNIVLFTGAGISVASGIPDFRSSNGLYSKSNNFQISPDEIISKSFFYNHTDMFYEFYKKHLIFPNAIPNYGHYYFSKLEDSGKLKYVITQNIDNLHQASGSKNVLELHGSVHRNNCIKCNKSYSLDYILNSNSIPYCNCGGIIKPDVVLYEESLDQKTLQLAIDAIKKSDLLIIVGTSLLVYPAAGLVRYFNGENLVIINKQTTPYDNIANLVINEDIIEVVKKIEN